MIVAKVFPGSPAEAGGIKPGDAELELNGNKIVGYEQLAGEVRKKKSGDKVVLTIERGGKRIEKRLVLKAAPEAK